VRIHYCRSLCHQHQQDAWNTDVTVVDCESWSVSLHHDNLSSQPAVGLTPSMLSVSLRWDTQPVLVIGQVDRRVCGRGKEQQKVDLMITGTTYTTALMQLVTNLRELVRPIVLQMGLARKKNKSKPPSLALLISQTNVSWATEKGDKVLGLVMELRECEAAGTLASGELNVSGLKLSQLQADQRWRYSPHLLGIAPNSTKWWLFRRLLASNHDAAGCYSCAVCVSSYT
jgi:hypothetical protein